MDHGQLMQTQTITDHNNAISWPVSSQKGARASFWMWPPWTSLICQASTVECKVSTISNHADSQLAFESKDRQDGDIAPLHVEINGSAHELNNVTAHHNLDSTAGEPADSKEEKPKKRRSRWGAGDLPAMTPVSSHAVWHLFLFKKRYNYLQFVVESR